MKGFSIVIVTWNGLHHLKKYLPSVLATDYPDYEVIIADNHSTDGTREWLREQHPDVKIAALDHNYGYCGGNNRALPFAEKELLLFLNNDVRVDSGWLHDLSAAFDKDEVAAAQPKILADQNPDSFEYAGAAGGFMDKFGYSYCRGRIFDHVEEDQGQYDSAGNIFWATGAALAVRKDLFAAAGGFDEDFEFHMEEIDLCWRLQNKGYTIRYVPGSVVYHLGGGSLPMGSPRKVYYNFRNTLYMLVKNYSDHSLFTRFVPRLFLDVVAAWKALVEGRPREFAAVAKAHFHFFKDLGQTLQKRKQLQSERSVENDPDTMTGNFIVADYYLKKITRFSRLNFDHRKFEIQEGKPADKV